MNNKALILTNSIVDNVHGETWDGQRYLLGLSLIKRLILTSNDCGISHYTVILSNEKKAIKDALLSDHRIQKRNLQISYLYVDHAHQDRVSLNENIWVFNDIHVLDQEKLGLLVNRMSKESKSFAFINNGFNEKSNLKALFAPGPESQSYSGICYCQPKHANKLLNILIDKGNTQLEEEEYIKFFSSNAVEKYQVDLGFTAQIHSVGAFEYSQSKLLQTARKATDGFIYRNLNRPVSLRISRFLLRYPVTPNMLSVANFVPGILSAIMVFIGGYYFTLLGGFLFYLSSVFDGCDGEVARLSFQVSERGSWIDTICDVIVYASFFVALSLNLSFGPNGSVYIYPVIISFISLIILYVLMVRYVNKVGDSGCMVRIIKDIEAEGRSEGFKGAINNVAAKSAFVTRRDFFSFTIFVFTIMGKINYVLVILSFIMPFAAMYLFFFSNSKFQSAKYKYARP